MTMLYIIRGLSGSGKSTIANKLASKDPNGVVVEADQFFTDPETGEYKYNKDLIRTAHAWCFKQVKQYLRQGKTVFVANTFTRIWEFQKYLDLAREMGIHYTILECKGEYKNVHNVPQETIEKMKERWENYPATPLQLKEYI